MNKRATMVRRDVAAVCALVFVMAAFLFAWTPSLRPGFTPARLTPPIITYGPAFPTTGDYQEQRDEYSNASLQCDRDPALIALSAAMMFPRDKRGQTDAVTPPLDVATRLLRFPDIPHAAQNDLIPRLTPPRPMPTLAPQRLTLPPLHAGGGQRHSTPPPAYRIDLTGKWQGRSVDLAPLLAINEPSGPWSFTVALQYDAAGRIQHALLESAALDQSLRDEVTRRLYQCRVTPGNAAGEGRLTVYGPGRP